MSGPHPLDVGHGRAPDEVSRKVRSFIGTELMSLEDGSSVTAQTRLLRGVADSLGVAQVNQRTIAHFMRYLGPGR